ncbi:hypothetical protein ATE47_05490 [Chryseobacterium sp. IHB B 17019]|nr:hypothetical protein ATE47_05490 [Chryseobacterium sp. IHB B 17019]
MSVLNDYKVNFRVVRVHNSDHKFMNSISTVLDALIVDFNNPINCNSLLKAIDIQANETGSFFYITRFTVIKNY